MEGFILVALAIVAFYQLSLRQDRCADQMFAREFDGYERTYQHVVYSCLASTVVRKQMLSNVPLPFIPATHFSVHALCTTEDKHWFWFDCGITNMKISRTSLTPMTDDEAIRALKETPELLKQYFPDHHDDPSDSSQTPVV